MADKKTEAMNEAKDAALNSVSFVISATKTQSLEMKKASLLAARNVVAVRKNLITLVNTFVSYKNIIKQIQSAVTKSGSSDSKLAKINIILQAGGDLYKQKEAEEEYKPKATELIKGIGKDLSVAAGSALALAIPFLLSPEMREMLVGFFHGFLEGLGLTKEALSKLKFGLGIATGILAAYFSAKVIMSVVDAFTKMKQLAEVLGLAGEAVNLEKTKIDAEKDKVKKAGKGTKAELDSAKKDMKKNSKGNLLKRLGVLKNQLGPKLMRLGKNFLKAIPVVGTILGIGLILYDLFDIGRDVWNFIKGEETTDAEVDQDTEQEDAASVAVTAEPSSAPTTVEAESKAPTSNTATPSPTTDTPATAPPPAEPTPSPSTSGAMLKESSIKVERADTDLAQTAGGVSILAVDNSTTIISNQNKPIVSSPSFYSVSVGA